MCPYLSQGREFRNQKQQDICKALSFQQNKEGQNRGESFGKDERGETTFSERLYEFHSTKIKGIIESSTSIENPLDTTVHLNVELYYGDIEPSLEDFSRPFKSQPPLSGNIKEIIKKKEKITTNLQPSQDRK